MLVKNLYIEQISGIIPGKEIKYLILEGKQYAAPGRNKYINFSNSLQNIVKIQIRPKVQKSWST